MHFRRCSPASPFAACLGCRVLLHSLGRCRSPQHPHPPAGGAPGGPVFGGPASGGILGGARIAYIPHPQIFFFAGWLLR